jgi:hypothetical protein
MKYFILLPQSDRAVVLVGETGFKSTADHNKATLFAADYEAKAACVERGIFTGRVCEHFKRPTLTAFERFFWDNGDRSSAAMASETNRTEAAVCAAYARAHSKLAELAAINARQAVVA